MYDPDGAKHFGMHLTLNMCIIPLHAIDLLLQGYAHIPVKTG